MTQINREQKLVDLCFDIALIISSDKNTIFKSMSNEQKAEWVAKQLELNGFKTVPCGSSHGVLHQ